LFDCHRCMIILVVTAKSLTGEISRKRWKTL
jgi:hypothetical protein